MPTIGWDENAPANGDAASAGDDAIRSLKTNVSGGLGTSMYWPGTAGGSAASAGIMKPGAARTFYAAESAVSAAQDGQLMYASDTSRLWYVGTTGPGFIGGQFGIECASNPGSLARWVLDSGLTGNGRTCTFSQTYGAAPRVFALPAVTPSDVVVPVVTATSTTTFRIDAYNASFATYSADATNVYWFSIGTVSL